MDYSKAIERVLEHLEEDNAEKAVMGCLRIARHLRDHIASAIFLRELYPDRKEVVRVLYDDLSELKEEAQKFVFEHSAERWIEAHTLNFDLSGDADGDRNILQVAVGEIESELVQWERSIADLTLPAGMAPFDVAAFTDRNADTKARMRLRIQAIQTIKSRIKARCLNYVIKIERQLSMQEAPENFLANVQTEVNNFFRTRSDDVYAKLQKASQLVGSRDLEDTSLLLTEVRRTLKAVADYFFPATAEPFLCADGRERLLGEDQFLNRLQEFMSSRLSRSTASALLRHELEQLSLYMRKLNDVASKGVHAEATFAEAKQGLVALYFFVFNLLQHLQRTDPQREAAA